MDDTLNARPYSLTAYTLEKCRELTDEEWRLQCNAITWAKKKGFTSSRLATLRPEELAKHEIICPTRQGRAKLISIDDSPLQWWGFVVRNHLLSKRYAFVKGAGRGIRCKRCLPGLRASEIEEIGSSKKRRNNRWKVEGACGKIKISLTLNPTNHEQASSFFPKS